MDIYGIKNCNTVKKALDWFQKMDIPYVFHDFKKEGLSESKLKQWEKDKSWEELLNKRGTTWRQLPAIVQAGVVDQLSANALMLAKTSIVKRPVIETADGIIVGFDEALYESKIK
ncbi:arsenate reductase [bacterium A37T11]|nr:arsenate reductase [bacterium A37T11]